LRALTTTVAVACTAAGLIGLAAFGVEPAATKKPRAAPNPQPAFYLTAAGAGDLRRQAYDAGARFARSQGPGRSLLALDFGAARLKDGTYGTALRSGTFFGNAQIRRALQAAARGYRDEYRQGSVTIVYANSNAYLGRPGPGYEAFTEETAREAGERQAGAVSELELYAHQTATVGGDIEPGYDVTADPDLSIAMVAGALAGADGSSYFDFGTAPCTDGKCVNGWTVQDVCEVASGGGRQAVPEIYFERLVDQPAQWAAVQEACRIEAFAGVSSSPLGELTPAESWRALKAETPVGVDPIVVVFPG
jgi:hypothetical protein